MEYGRFKYQEVVVHNACPHCGCGGEVNNDPMTCGQCGKLYTPTFVDPEIADKLRREAKKRGDRS